MKKVIPILLLIIAINKTISYADSLMNTIDDIQIVASSDDNNSINQILMQKITINKSFNNIDQVASTIERLTKVKTKVFNQSADKTSAVNINQTNGSISAFLDKVTKQLHYTWKISEANILVFSAINPLTKQELTYSETVKSAKQTELQTWELSGIKDKTVKSGVTKWANKAGWQLIWKPNIDFEIEADALISGTFDYAINEICRASQFTNKQLLADFHPKNKVVVIYTSVLR